MYYLNYFFLFSIIGNILESFVYSNGDSGILLGPWTPVYGIGTIIILFTYHFLTKKRKLTKFTKFIAVFLIGVILLSIIEAIGGYLIEWIFGFSFWDYSNYNFNIGKYVAVEMSLIWGLGSIAIIYFFKPLIDKFILKIPKSVTYTLIGIFIIDIILTIIVKH